MRICMDCGSGEIVGRSWRCEPCKARRNVEHVRNWARRNPDVARAAHKRRYAADPSGQRERARRYRAANPEKVREQQRRTNAQGGRRYYLKSRYGLTPEQVEVAFRAQEGRCAICRKVVDEAPTARNANWIHGLVIDHDHDTGAFRGLLCPPCNSAIGQLKDDPEIIRRAAAYVAAHAGQLTLEGEGHP